LFSKEIKKINHGTSKQIVGMKKKTFYEKNICRNIIRKAIRSIESEAYDTELSLKLQEEGLDLEEFRRTMVMKIEALNGPSHLKTFLKTNCKEALVFKNYLLWFLKERYIR